MHASPKPDLQPAEPIRHLYVHVPFCSHKCEYCAFYSAPAKGDQIQRYVEALVREIGLVAPRCRPETVFFGGGTPSLLGIQHWETLLATLRQHALLGAAEFTVECNPATVSSDKARLLRSAGVNRVSMGVQSLDEGLLERLGRVHSRSQVFKSIDILRDAGFDNLSIDLMFAIPGQTMALWEATLDEALALGTEHLSCYEVIYEEDTPLYEQLKAGRFDVDEELACAQYDRLVERADAAGLHQYEVANFGRAARAGLTPPASPPDVPAFACRHNVAYWRGHDFFGLGPSASEYVDGVRSRNRASTVLYVESALRGHRAKEFAEALPPLARAGELAAFGLRMNAGWPFDAFARRTGYDLREEWADDIAFLVGRGWGECLPDRFRLTPRGLRFADTAAERMLRT